ncbi:cupin domain-containing protein [Blastochloris viridis]|uniref:Cupin type-2 domain-containing protein n=1 Tax=Blastochloris viridis TaxID=1079 RepID=A0A0H5BAA6_BLAVI|nr:cupin domain-containing protein [Blastochloris viridis]ALK10906.1 Cupin domain protein [Blastochloris viridis]BAR99115.1 hypothetical protein BV133_1522 [Blastochloris viridis]CUU43568.1 hypothetical protein BVIRIDIS_25920 [Blastochloris viridis]
MKKTLADIAPRTATLYPPPLDAITAGRTKYALGNAFGLDQFGVNLTELAPGAASALRHWHAAEDEFVFVLAGEITLVDDAGAQVLQAGEFVGFKAGVANAHHFVNRTAATARYLEVGTRAPHSDTVHYPDHDLLAAPGPDGRRRLLHNDGTPY